MTNTSDTTAPHSPVIYHAPDCAQTAARLASLCRVQMADAPPADLREYAGWLDESGFALIPPGTQRKGAEVFRLDAALLPEALKPGRARASLLLRACGAAPDTTVLDPFAGFALDALQLCQAGCQVQAIERHPLVVAMARDLAQQLLLPIDIQRGDALEALRQSGPLYDVVYLDPMFPQRNKKALPGLAMQHLQHLTFADGQPAPDIESLLTLARARARRRVVLKRRLKDPVSGTPQFQIKGQKIRFDVYA